MPTKFEKIIQALPTTALSVAGSRIAYIDEEGVLRTGLYGINRHNFSEFAEWVAELAREES